MIIECWESLCIDVEAALAEDDKGTLTAYIMSQEEVDSVRNGERERGSSRYDNIALWRDAKRNILWGYETAEYGCFRLLLDEAVVAGGLMLRTERGIIAAWQIQIRNGLLHRERITITV